MTFHLGRSRGLLRNVIPALRVLARWDAPNATTTLASFRWIVSIDRRASTTVDLARVRF